MNASLVIFSHNFRIFGLGFEPFYSLTRYTSLAGLAVYIFYIISGFLITKSWKDKPNIIIFFQKRLLRIYPALVAAIFFGAFIIGPLVTSLSSKEYITNPVTWDYVKSIFLYPMRYNLPGVFTDNPYLSAVNSSLWTLPIEVFMYFSIAFIGVFGLLSKKAFVPALLVAMIFLDWYTLSKPEY